MQSICGTQECFLHHPFAFVPIFCPHRIGHHASSNLILNATLYLLFRPPQHLDHCKWASFILRHEFVCYVL